MKVIYIFDQAPVYAEYSNKPRPKWNWDLKNGSWVGIWGYDWGDIIGKNVTEYDDEIHFEVWQVDERADKIYEAEIAPRVVHKQYPAKRQQFYFGIRKRGYYYSEEIINDLEKWKRDNTLFIVCARLSPFRDEVVKHLVGYPLLYAYYINAITMLPKFSFSLNPLKFINRLLQRRANIKNVKSIKHLYCGTVRSNKEILTKNPDMVVHKTDFGIDLDFWKPIKSKAEARNSLNISQTKFVMVLSQRLVPEYQIDKFMMVLSSLRATKDYEVFITGHGLRDYEKYLYSLVDKYSLTDKVHFVGYVSNEDLRDYFIAADLFLTVPRMFAGSTGASKAMAVGTPIFHVTEGETYYDLKEHNAGILVSPTDYDQWKRELEEIIAGKEVKRIDKRKVTELYGQEASAKRLIKIFRDVIDDYKKS